jgi:hypothetical protein
MPIAIHNVNNMKWRARRRKRRGFILVIMIVLFAICATLFTLWARSAVHEQASLVGEGRRLQAGRLAEAGIARAVARRAADPQYDGETWSIAAADLAGLRAAEVQIRVTPAEDATRVEATAVYPVETERRAQVTRRLEIPNRSTSSAEDES